MCVSREEEWEESILTTRKSGLTWDSGPPVPLGASEDRDRECILTKKPGTDIGMGSLVVECWTVSR